MLVNFDSLEETSKIWIYQSNRAFTENEIAEIIPNIESFIGIWKRHGEDLKASYQIKYNQFIVIAVDENYNEVSGCSIDALVNLIKQFEQKFTVDLTNRLNISFKDNDNINVVSLADFQHYAKQQKITPNTVVFNNMLTKKADFAQNWEVTADKSWHKRFLVINN
ncbi:MAG: ABC transporter ATPase [Lutibacter sp.]|nr:ABC transporter ATPase [Lutibacter sp.]